MSRPIQIPRGADDEWSAGANEIINMLFHYIDKSKKTYKQVEKEAGLGKATLTSWRDEGAFPRLDYVMRALFVVGYSLVTIRNEEYRAFALPGYFTRVVDKQERLRCEKEGLPLTTVFGTPEWEEANSFRDWPTPTAEEIADESRFQRLAGNISAEKVAALSPEERQELMAESARFHEERLKKIAESEKSHLERRRKLFEGKRQAKKRAPKHGVTTPAVKRRRNNEKMKRTRERLERRATVDQPA